MLLAILLVVVIVFDAQGAVSARNADVVVTDPADKTVALVFSDIKLDDKVALHILITDGRYDTVIVVINAVENIHAAAGDLFDFLGKMPNPDPEPSDECHKDTKVVVLAGLSILNETAVHEVNFIGEPARHVVPAYTSNAVLTPALVQHIAACLVDIYQIAPTDIDQLRNLMDARQYGGADTATIQRFHLVHGFNSLQRLDFERRDPSASQTDAATLSVGQDSVLPNIGTNLNLPPSRVVFTCNTTSFDRSASSQPFAEIAGRVPLDHLNAAIQDRFHARQLLKAVHKLALLRVEVSAVLDPSLPEKAGVACLQPLFFDSPQLNAKLQEFLEKHSPHSSDFLKDIQDSFIVDLHTSIVDARLSDLDSIQRQHFLKYIKDIKQLVEIETGPASYNRYLPRVERAFSEAVSVELCDANHIIAVLNTSETALAPIFFNGKVEICLYTAHPAQDSQVHGSTFCPKFKADDCLKLLQKRLNLLRTPALSSNI